MTALIKTARAGVLDIAYEETGNPNGQVAILLHGFPYDVRAFDEVVPPLAAAGLRVIVPYLRGFGPTRFAGPTTMRSGQQAALAIMDGVPARDAVRWTRTHYHPKAVETPWQRWWLRTVPVT